MRCEYCDGTGEQPDPLDRLTGLPKALLDKIINNRGWIHIEFTDRRVEMGRVTGG